jgi:ribosomal protein L11 methyltransferase
VSDLALGLGALAVSEVRPPGRRVEDEIGPSPEVVLAVLLPPTVNPEDLLAKIGEILSWKSPPLFHAERVSDEDWVRVSREQFRPMGVGRRLWVVPSWHSPPEPPAIHVVLDPGLAFGTGEHPTTRLCLEWLDANIEGGERVLDYGCGSGILAIAALKLGAREAVGADVEPQALGVSAANARRNGVHLSLFLPDEAPPLTADLVTANILANPLMELAATLAGRTWSGGRIALSGILESQGAAVGRAYEPWFDLAPPRVDSGWVLLTGRRR